MKFHHYDSPTDMEVHVARIPLIRRYDWVRARHSVKLDPDINGKIYEDAEIRRLDIVRVAVEIATKSLPGALLALQNSSFLMRNSSFSVHNFSFLIHNSSFLIQNSSILMQIATGGSSFDQPAS